MTGHLVCYCNEMLDFLPIPGEDHFTVELGLLIQEAIQESSVVGVGVEAF